MNASVEQLARKLEDNETVYGVTTGYGGSANTRTESYAALQKALMQHQAAGILLPGDRGRESGSATVDSLKSHAIPIPVVRAAMLTRCNSLLRGHSAVRPVVVQNVLILLAKDMTPVVPLRGSISASGDLMPLAYLAGMLEGNPDISVNCGKEQGYRVIGADQALAEAGLSPLELRAKEGLGIMNGTAFSCGAASVVLYEANQLLLLSQVLTAMGTEALIGHRGNYDPFIAKARPHPGQKEAAENMFEFLADSKLISEAAPGKIGTAKDNHALAQDRYALRTSSQWMGPQIEDMALALTQVEVELNSTTDNPLIDPDRTMFHHGGNFQAAAVTSAMEKTMTSVQMLGKMIFSQCSELINPATSKGLPPNLTADDPSLSYAFKGVDINMAAYMSELAYLNHPVSNHVQSAEMHNQGLNSLALIAARYTGDAVEVLSLMSAAYLFTLCQALDLRALHISFVHEAHRDIQAATTELCGPSATDFINGELWEELMGHWSNNSAMDPPERAQITTTASMGRFLSLVSHYRCPGDLGTITLKWQETVSSILSRKYDETRKAFFKEQTTKEYLCHASKQMYSFVRETLGIPMHIGLADHATHDGGDGRTAHDKPLIGSHISKLYVALRDGALRPVLLSCWERS